MKLIGYLLTIVSVVFILLQWTTDTFSVDTCLDAGGVYNYVTNSCRNDINSLPYLKYSVRFSEELLSCFIAFLLGDYLIIKSRKRMYRRRY